MPDAHLTQGWLVLVSLNVDLLGLGDLGDDGLGAGPGLQGEAGAAKGAQAVQHRGREHRGHQRVKLENRNRSAEIF